MPKVNGGPHSTARTRGNELRQRDMTSLFAFLHHIAAFSLVAALTVELDWELIGVVLLILCAALMARGVGYFGAQPLAQPGRVSFVR